MECQETVYEFDGTTEKNIDHIRVDRDNGDFFYSAAFSYLIVGRRSGISSLSY